MAYSKRTHPTNNARGQQCVPRRNRLRIPAISLLMWLAIAQPCYAGAFGTQDANRTTANSEPALKLEPGKPIERELAGGALHVYSIQMLARQFLRVTFDQRGIDLVVTVFEPGGKQLNRIDSPNDTQGPEPVTLIAEASGNYRLEVSSVRKTAAAGRYEVKLEALRTAVPEDNRLIELNELINIGTVHSERAVEGARFENGRDNYDLALEYYEKSLRLSESLGNQDLLALMLFSVGRINSLQGNHAPALANYQRVLTAYQAAGNKRMQAITLSNMGLSNFLQSDYAPALEHYRQSLKLSEELGNKRAVAASLGGMSLVYRNIGSLGQALACAQRSLALHESLGNKSAAAGAHMNIALVYGSLGDFERAQEHYRKSLTLSEESGNKNLNANALVKMANVLNRQDYDKALEYAHRSLKLSEEMKNHRYTIYSIMTLGNIYESHGDHVQALKYFQKGLALSEKHGEKPSVADALMKISNSQMIKGNHAQALEATLRAATIASQIGNAEILVYAFNQSGFLYLSLNQLENARRASEQAIEIVESLRASVAGNEARAGYFAKARGPYDLGVEVLMQLHKQRPGEGYAAAAFQMSERARARSLLETLSEARADIRQGVDPALLTSERALQQRLNATAERQTRLLSGKHTEEQASALRKEIDLLSRDYQQVEAQIRQSSPRYAALTQPAPLTASEIQSKVLDNDTALLEYALGWERSYLWVVTPSSVLSFELPKRDEIETSVRRVVELLSDGQRWATSAEINTEYAAAAGQLGRMLLPPEMMSQLKVKRLVIVGDGALQYLPFGSLPNPTSKVQSSKSRSRRQSMDAGQPLIADYEIVSLPSASILAVLRRETANRARPAKSVAVLADPVFEETDERVQTATAQGRHKGNGQPAATTGEASFDESLNSQLLLRAFQFKPNADPSSTAPERVRIARLPFTRFEAEGILASDPSGQNLKATGFRANRETATGADLGQYRFLHFATHGILNSEHPELSGIVLSLVNDQGQPVDGFLRLHDIYNLNLPADLVVLSACQTGLGKEIRGEGLVGLTRGFMYAGAPRVVASLWKVDDAATAELMKIFYRGMLKENMRPAAALRAAKVEMWKQKRWQAPFYWAAFELQGEWK